MSSDLSASADRDELILQELLRNGEVSVESLAKRFNVSAATIRRDLTELERQGLLRRNHVGTSLIWQAADVDTLVTDKATSDDQIVPFTEKNIVVLRA